MTVASIIDIALAPVFLITGISALLSMLTIRLARVVDRWRLLESRSKKLPEEEREPIVLEARVTWRRVKLITWSIRLAVTSALLVCVIISLLFLGDFAAPFVGGSIAYLFVTTMVVMTLSFSTLLAEVSISTNSLKQKMEHALFDEHQD